MTGKKLLVVRCANADCDSLGRIINDIRKVTAAEAAIALERNEEYDDNLCPRCGERGLPTIETAQHVVEWRI